MSRMYFLKITLTLLRSTDNWNDTIVVGDGEVIWNKEVNGE